MMDKCSYIDVSAMPVVLTVPQVAQVLGICKNTTYALLRSGDLKSIRVGRKIRVSKDSLLEFIAA